MKTREEIISHLNDKMIEGTSAVEEGSPIVTQSLTPYGRGYLEAMKFVLGEDDEISRLIDKYVAKYW